MRLRLAALGALLSLTQAGCSDLGDSLRLEPACETSAVALDFGVVVLGDSAERNLTLRSRGTGPLSGVVPAGCAPYRVISGAGPFSLAPGETLGVVVRFVPAAAAVYSCSLDLGNGCGSLGLLGVGQAPATGTCDLSAPALDFGDLGVGDVRDGSFAIRSVGTAALGVDVGLVSPCGDFLIVSGGGPALIPPGDSVVVTIRFNPLSTGAKSCAVDLGTDCPDVLLGGNGTVTTTVSFAGDIQPIFDNHCNGCHNSSGTGGLNLSSTAVSYLQLVNVTSFGYAPAKRVVPFDLVNSVLYGKITNSGQFGQSMPQNRPLITQAEQDKIKAWIQEGAQNN